MTWDNQRKQQFRHALQDVYRSYSALQIFVRDAIDRNLAEIVEQSGLTSAAFELVEWSEAKGEIDRLYAAFCLENDYHPLATSIDASTDAGLNLHNSGAFTSPTSSSSSSGSMSNPGSNSGSNSGSNPGRIINIQGGGYHETHLHDRTQYAEGDINNQTDQHREQKGLNINDQGQVTIQHQEIHYHGSSSPSVVSNSSVTPSVTPQPTIARGDRYVSHTAIEGVCQAALTNNGALIRIKAPHQMGKTELAARLCDFAETQSYDCVVIDFQKFNPSQLTNLDQFWRCLCQMIIDQLDIETPLDTHWNTALLGSNSSCEKYLEKAVLKQIDQALILILENVDRLFEELTIAEQVFRLIRAFHERAKISKVWRKLRQVLTYSTEPLAKLDFANTHYSPFNVGKEIELPSLAPMQVAHLAEQFGLQLNEAAIAQLMTDFGGHPALLQQAFDRLAFDPTLELTTLYTQAQHPASSHLRNLTHQLDACGLTEIMARVAGATEPIAIPEAKAYALYRLGLVDWDGDRRRVKPRCRLYRDRFASV
ncbi:MAG: hypothetical protein HC795_15280 [Coleofasciculaceae cyanobacterium RL_1_1]|nr:hypothetical protein [Coleofasciculaceae cyanobacterium RL_1_1]